MLGVGSKSLGLPKLHAKEPLRYFMMTSLGIMTATKVAKIKPNIIQGASSFRRSTNPS
ncbi:MAG: hypothetical protein QMD21_02745 [Candidatus Thermoplasmatota archaeon]|nr:hypothetical protein [Candidatus Thermoplasmatota archaeon]